MKTLTTEDVVNGLIKFEGVDTEKFLQGQTTCDISELQENHALTGAFCTPKGRIKATFILYQVTSTELLMILPKPQIEFLMESLAPYIAFSQCDMSDVSDDWHQFGLQLTDGSHPLSTESVFNDLPAVAWESTNVDGLISIKLPGDINRWYCLSSQPVTTLLANTDQISAESWQVEDMKAGFVWINDNNREQFLPHDISLPAIGGVSFTKGCYTGQEIIARMHYRGKPKYSLGIITTESTETEISDKLVAILENEEEKKVGRVVDKLHLKDSRWLLLASVKNELLEQKQFQLASNKRSILCTIVTPELTQK